METKDGVATVKTYWPTGLGVEIQRGQGVPELHWTHLDRLGSPMAISNKAGVIEEKLAYDSWGKRRNLNDGATPDALDGKTDNRGFTGHEMLDDLDLVHMNGRVYDPLLGRFLSADLFVQDPMNGQSYNRFSYVLNNPTNLTDPTGFMYTGCGGLNHCDVSQSMQVTSWTQSTNSFSDPGYSAATRDFYQESGSMDPSDAGDLMNELEEAMIGYGSRDSEGNYEGPRGVQSKTDHNFTIGKKQFVAVGGTEAQQKAVEAKLREIFASPLGKTALANLEARRFLGNPTTFEIDLKARRRNWHGISDLGDEKIYIDPYYTPKILTAGGKYIYADLRRSIYHELGHAAFEIDDVTIMWPDASGKLVRESKMENVRRVENVFAKWFNEPERIEYK